MKARNRGYSPATARSMAKRARKQEAARKMFFEEGLPKVEIMESLGVTRTTLNMYLRERATIPKYR